MRATQRANDELRLVNLTRSYTKYAEGSVLIAYGNTKVLCTASVLPGVPKFLQGSNQGWITAEYGMLPRATHTRSEREASRGKQTGRSLEIQRLIGRVLRMSVDLKNLKEQQKFVAGQKFLASMGHTKIFRIEKSLLDHKTTKENMKVSKKFS